MTAAPVRQLVEQLTGSTRDELGPSLVGLYLFGSLVLGGFDPERSDVDLLAVTTDLLSADQFGALDRAHARFLAEHPEWADRLEIAYVPAPVLERYPNLTGLVARMSPGEPFHVTPFLPHWLADLYTVQEHGVALHGPAPRDVLPAVSRGDFRACIRAALGQWRGWIDESDAEAFLGYAALTICRSIYALERGEQASKIASAGYVRDRYPQWRHLVADALGWREERSGRRNSRAHEECGRFLSFALTLAPHTPAGAARPPS